MMKTPAILCPLNQSSHLVIEIIAHNIKDNKVTNMIIDIALIIFTLASRINWILMT